MKELGKDKTMTKETTLYVLFIYYYQNVGKKKSNDYTILRLICPDRKDAQRHIDEKRRSLGELFMKAELYSHEGYKLCKKSYSLR